MKEGIIARFKRKRDELAADITGRSGLTPAERAQAEEMVRTLSNGMEYGVKEGFKRAKKEKR